MAIPHFSSMLLFFHLELKQHISNIRRPNLLSYTHGIMNLGVSVCSCALDSVFLIDDCMDAGDRVMQEQLTEKKRKPSGLSRVFLIDAYKDVGTRATQEQVAEKKLKMRYRCA